MHLVRVFQVDIPMLICANLHKTQFTDIYYKWTNCLLGPYINNFSTCCCENYLGPLLLISRKATTFI